VPRCRLFELILAKLDANQRLRHDVGNHNPRMRAHFFALAAVKLGIDQLASNKRTSP
jgi:hypothetical protein